MDQMEDNSTCEGKTYASGDPLCYDQALGKHESFQGQNIWQSPTIDLAST